MNIDKRSNITGKLISGLMTIVTGLLLFSPTAYAVEYGGIGGRPAYPRDANPRSQSIFVHTLEPGQIVEEGVLMVNNTDKAKTLMVYATDSEVATGGAFTCKQLSDPQLSVGSWIWLAGNEVTLEPATSQVIPFTISAPKSASAGEHNGCIVIQEKKEKVDGQAGMSLTFRTGLRVAITVPGDITRQLEIVSFESQKRNNKIYFKSKVKNTGNVSIDANVKVYTSHLLKLESYDYGGRYPVLRGESAEWSYETKKVFWGGLYKAVLYVSYNDQLGLGESDGYDTVVLTSPAHWFFVMPSLWAWVIYGSISVILITAVTLLIIFKRRKNWIQNNWIDYEVKKGDDLQKIAENLDISWKKLVKVNGLIPPYTLEIGKIIKVPPNK